ncbi:23S rRNA (adenine(1618)-N(6))-methyltransferase RlmF [Carboxylicivirga sp. M1479]|uniref:23S rRNA (adenine(1618)-N(6))-methyltransferase RlmF n=1 Tax=Carboxylicivirga sp. M1479 TaxID=2594476 RepID=UPI001177B0F7|nr:23S rRNA (adenine(1618)-N(6))-methyltransferase RlmF [Carboxylicivirga sp. M1479]TRX66315.1 23S rRNA (adenine(1618)-N(6))-methyltransferase RlmF [Carboxylicivirga sp. M1479]
MVQKKRVHPKVKAGLHVRNKHRERYNFKELIQSCPELAPFVSLNKFDDESIDFGNPKAVVMLNRAVLKHFYGIDHWYIPEGFLCPPVPGRADYIHNVADLLASENKGVIPMGKSVKCLDVGVGANCIYPIIGHTEYGWSFVGADVEQVAIDSARETVENNEALKGNVDLRLQTAHYNTFKGIIADDEYYDVTICNPPFHASLAEAEASSLRKMSSLNKTEVKKVVLNFGGNGKELYCNGGEERFITNMIKQSKEFSQSCLWFSTLVSKESNLRTFRKALKGLGVEEVKAMKMSQGTKVSRVLAWTFHNKEQQQAWAAKYWSE